MKLVSSVLQALLIAFAVFYMFTGKIDHATLNVAIAILIKVTDLEGSREE